MNGNAWSFALICGLIGTPLVAAERYALVIGVNQSPQFRMTDGSSPRPLRGAESDADAVAKVLTTHFGFSVDKVQVLKGTQASYARVRGELMSLAKRARSQDAVVIYYSGHGTQIPDQGKADEEDHLDEALCLADCDDQGHNLLVDDELGVLLDAIEAARLTVILDCCHAGTATKDADDELASRYLPFPASRPTNSTPTTGNTRQHAWRELKSSTKAIAGRRAALFACQPQQQAYERRLPHQIAPARSGQFTHHLLHGLTSGESDANQDGLITEAEAVAYACSRLDATFNRGRDEAVARQEPTLESDNADGGFIVDRDR